MKQSSQKPKCSNKSTSRLNPAPQELKLDRNTFLRLYKQDALYDHTWIERFLPGHHGIRRPGRGVERVLQKAARMVAGLTGTKFQERGSTANTDGGRATAGPSSDFNTMDPAGTDDDTQTTDHRSWVAQHTRTELTMHSTGIRVTENWNRPDHENRNCAIKRGYGQQNRSPPTNGLVCRVPEPNLTLDLDSQT